MVVLECRGISKVYVKGFFRKKTVAVRGLSFCVEGGGVTGFVGANGAGKTTCIKVLLGLLKAGEGGAFIRGVSSDNYRARRKVSYLSEQPYFYKHLSVVESLTFAGRLHGVSKKQCVRNIEEVLERVCLTDRGNSKIHTLSKGLQQRCSLAHALVSDPEIYILDEPMSGLDPIGRSLFRDIFKELAKEGKTVFFSTHILEDIESICDSIIALSKGSMVYSGNIQDLISRHTSGTEIVVGNISDLCRNDLTNQGNTVSDINNNNLIFIPNDKKVHDCQDYLLENGIYPQSIKPRAESIEKILYKNELGENTK